MAGNTNSGRGGKAGVVMELKPTKSTTFTLKPSPKLHRLGKRFWKSMAPMLVEAGVLTDLDGFAFDRLCQLCGMWMDSRDKITKDGMTYETETDRGAKRHLERPEVKIMKGLEKEIQTLERKFGLTPGDRESIKAHAPSKQRKRTGNSLAERY